MSAPNKMPSVQEYASDSSGAEIEMLESGIEGDVQGYDGPAMPPALEPLTEAAPSTAEDVPSRFTPRSVLAGISKWIAQKRAAKRQGAKPFGPANSELFDESGALLETSPPEGTLAERHPDWPVLKVNVLLSRHETAEDYRSVQERLEKKPDILLYEGADGTDYKDGKSGYTRLLQALSDGRFRLKDVNAQGREKALMESIYDSGVKVGSIDTTKKESAAIGLQAASEASLVTAENYDVTLDGIKEYNARLAEAQNKRDAIMAQRFEHEIGRILEQNPELKQKDELDIFIPLGAYHTKLGRSLRRMGVETDVEFDGIDYEDSGEHSGISAERSYVYNHVNRLQRTLAFGREPSRELVEKAYATYMIAQLLPSTEDDQKSKVVSDYRDAVVGALESEDIQAMHEGYAKGLPPPDIQAIVERRLAAKGLPPLIQAPQDMYAARDNPSTA